MPRRSGRTNEEQQAADEYHEAKCCTTKWMCWSSISFFIGLVLIITSVGVYYGFDLDRWSGAQYAAKCYIYLSHQSSCNTVSCDNPYECNEDSYVVKPAAEFNVAESECTQWDNGCCAFLWVTECAKDRQYADEQEVDCYSYAIDSPSDDLYECNEAGRLDDQYNWKSQRGSYVALLVFGVLLLIIAVVLFIVGFSRCVFKKVEDDVLGETNGTGCYWCMDYERCCYGESHGHATIVNPSGKSLPVKDKKRDAPKSKTTKEGERRKKRRKKESSSDDDYTDEEQGLR